MSWQMASHWLGRLLCRHGFHNYKPIWVYEKDAIVRQVFGDYSPSDWNKCTRCHEKHYCPSEGFGNDYD